MTSVPGGKTRPVSSAAPLALAMVALLVGQSIVHAADSGWQPLRVPGYWEKQHGGTITEHDGFAWYRAFVIIPSSWTGKTLTLSLGQIDDCDQTFFNGAEVGATGTREPFQTASNDGRNYAVAPHLVRPGQYNLIAVRVFDGGGAGGIWRGTMEIGCDQGALSLAGRWQFRAGDNLAWATWPLEPDSGDALALARDFELTAGPGFGKPIDRSPLPGTKALEMQGDIASQLVDGVDRFLLREIERSEERRVRHWKRDFASPPAYEKSLEPQRKRLSHQLGVRDGRVEFDAPELLATTMQSALVGRGQGFEVYAVRWPAFGDVHGEGLLLVPVNRAQVADVVAIPDADQTPEQLAGLAAGIPAESQFARRLAEAGCRVVVPALIDRRMEPRNGRANLTSREFLYRSAFELGRHLIGYEVQKVLAAVDWFQRDAQSGDARIGVVGWGEGGMLALYAGALDPRIDAVCVSGHFDDRNKLWQQPIDRNVFGLLDQFGDAELASMIAPRALIVEAAKGPELTLPSQGGAPAQLVTPRLEDVRREVERARKLIAGLKPAPRLELVISADGYGPYGTDRSLSALLQSLAPQARMTESGSVEALRKSFDTEGRQKRQQRELDRHSQALLAESPYVRQEFMKNLDTSSLEKYQKSAETYREFFATEVIGRFDQPLLPPHVRSRRAYEGENWTGYEVVMDVYPDVIAYGILLLPKDLKEGQKRPVVVCQHGLEGRPQDVIAGDQDAYHDFAARLAERGFITFAPQNLYVFKDRFRTLQRKANPLQKTLFSIIVPQHQQITDWLKSLPYVDGDRIAFYGLSYGGKTAMRVPALVDNYCLSICSADFNEWVWKNTSTRSPYSYVWTGEYEIFEFDLGSTFNYAEMAALIAPRPFMVERGHFDGVAPDEAVGYEFAKVRHLYQARLGIGDRCQIEWFVGPHTINGQGTFEFLHRHLNWPAP